MEKNKNKKKLEWLMFIIGLSILFVGILLDTTPESEIQSISEEKQDIELEVSKYLKEKYNKDFELEMIFDGYFRPQSVSAPIFFDDKNIREFVFEVTSDDMVPKFFVTYWKYIDTGKIEIEEVNAVENNEKDTSYEKIYKFYSQKQEIKSKLEKILEEDYTGYTIDYYEDIEKISINLNHEINEKLEIDLENTKEIISLLKELDIRIRINYGESFRFEYNDVSKEADITECYNFIKELDEYLKNTYNGTYKYQLDGFSDTWYTSNNTDIAIKFSIDTQSIINSSSQEEVFEKIYKDILNIAIQNSHYVYFIFEDGREMKLNGLNKSDNTPTFKEWIS